MAITPIQFGLLAGTMMVACPAGAVVGADLQTDLLVKPLNCPLMCPNGTDNGIYCIEVGGTMEGSTTPMTPRWACDLMPAMLGVADNPVTHRDPTYTIQCPANSHLISYGLMYQAVAYACYNDSRATNGSSATTASPAPAVSRSPSPATKSSPVPVVTSITSTNGTTNNTSSPAPTKVTASPAVASSTAVTPSSSAGLLSNQTSGAVSIPTSVSCSKPATSAACRTSAASLPVMFAGLLAAIALMWDFSDIAKEIYIDDEDVPYAVGHQAM